MKFGPVPTAEAEGTILAHSVVLAGRRLRKGRVLSGEDVAVLAAEGIASLTVARLEPGDVGEDEAAARIAAALAPDPAGLGLAVQAPFTGRVNLHAAETGVLRVDAEAVRRLNAVDEAVTLATLPDLSRVSARDMVATVKILPYAVPGRVVDAAADLLAADPPLRLHRVARRSADIIATRISGMKPSVIEKGFGAIRTRLAALGVTVASETVTGHETEALRAALGQAEAEMILILGGSATQDRGDVGPAALIAAGGRIERFGMPVDPGNLLFLGALGDRPVIGLPG
ncbi:MAG: molybdopterin biosynthesis protein, partial [Alphaproteobacteria bacterium]